MIRFLGLLFRWGAVFTPASPDIPGRICLSDTRAGRWTAMDGEANLLVVATKRANRLSVSIRPLRCS